MSVDLKRKNFIVRLGCFCACVVFFAVLMCCVPLSSDDFEFSTLSFSGLRDIFDYALKYGNGRLLGNMGAVLLARNPMAAVLAKALVISALIFLLPALLGLETPAMYLLSFLLFVLIRPGMFGQVYTWTSGFNNYLPPVLISMLVLCLQQRCKRLPAAAAKLPVCAAVFALGFAGQLFVEHASIVNLVMAAALVIYSHKVKSGTAAAYSWLAAAILGFAAMSLIPELFAMPGNRAEGYRGFVNGGVLVMLHGMVRGFSSTGAAFPPVGSVIISVFALHAACSNRAQRSGKLTRLLTVLSMLCLSYILLNEFVLGNQWQGRMLVVKNFVTAVFALLPLLLWAWALYPLQDRALRNRIYVLLGLSLLSLAPFVLVYPTPERVAFQAYVFAAAAVLLYSARLLEKQSDSVKKLVTTALCCGAAAAVLLLGMTFSNILWLSGIREEYILREMEKGAEEITIFQIPHGYVFWDGPYLFGRKYYYENWHDISFREASFDIWFFEHWSAQ